MALHRWQLLCVWSLALWHMALGRKMVNMGGDGCFMVEDILIDDDEIVTVYADYKPTHEATLDHCDVTLRALQTNRRLEYLVERLTIFDCGITLQIFEHPQILTNPSRTLTCSDANSIPIQTRTSKGEVKFSLRKHSTQAKAFAFQIQIKTDYGPPFDFERDSSEFYELPLDIGTIVGLVIAASVLIIIVTGLAIYCCLKTRAQNRRKQKASKGAPAVVYQPSSSKSEMGRGGGGHRGSSPDSRLTSTKEKTSVYSNSVYSHKANGIHEKEGVDGHFKRGRSRTEQGFDAPHKDKYDSIRSHKDHHHQYNNHAYEKDNDEKKLERQASYRRSQKGNRYNSPSDEAEYSQMRSGGHISRRDSSRGSKHDPRGRSKEREVTRAQQNGSVRRGKSLNHSRSSTEWSVTDTGSDQSHRRPHSQHTRESPHLQRSGSRSRSRNRGLGSHRSGSASRSRAGSVGRSGARDSYRDAPRSHSRDQQYGYMSDRGTAQDSHRSRARSSSAGRSRRH